jgi:exodeoxyribonuclease VII large subunit
VWFDNEKLGRAVAGFPLPIVSGIGHEQDSSVLDALARSAKTPTAAAMFLVEQVGVALQAVEEAGGSILELAAEMLGDAAVRDRDRAGRLARATRNLLAHARTAAVHRGRRLAVGTRNLLSGARSDLHRASSGVPRAAEVRLASSRSDLVKVREHLGPAVRRLLALAGERIDGRQTRLTLSDPARVVERGFAVLRNKAGKAIRDPDDAPQGTELTAQLRGGRLGLRSTGKEE